MLNQIETVLARSSDTLVEDFLGGAALVLLLVAALYLPAMF